MDKGCREFSVLLLSKTHQVLLIFVTYVGCDTFPDGVIVFVVCFPKEHLMGLSFFPVSLLVHIFGPNIHNTSDIQILNFSDSITLKSQHSVES